MRRALLFWGLVSLGCGGNAVKTVADGGGADLSRLADMLGSKVDMTGGAVHDLSTSQDLAVASVYPTGPYGNTVGATFPLLMWQGYVDLTGDAIATTKPFGPYSMDGVRTSGRAYAMIHVADYT